eukprot:COSAG05_NODE_1064_length_5991_cov_12.180414_16_plen_82_part_01
MEHEFRLICVYGISCSREALLREKAARVMQRQVKRRLRRRAAATRIQAAWLGYRSRKVFGPEVRQTPINPHARIAWNLISFF